MRVALRGVRIGSEIVSAELFDFPDPKTCPTSATHQKAQLNRVSLLTHLTYLTLTMYPFQPTPPPNHRFDDDDGGFDPDRLAHYDALTCRVVPVQRSRVMS